ncbi:cilia- and flagella-associated protein 100 isoform X1 [Hydra vulgaris]|uniref:cilia- and flagella-associated protein 100 isoform X1 n=1 Tax=Hydra vulgaris TaxID=6087 RepID=UPI001F5E4003|nr:cilia- and flagella-associated protein 100 isoform X1 [Hydra vulgaris]
MNSKNSHNKNKKKTEEFTVMPSKNDTLSNQNPFRVPKDKEMVKFQEEEKNQKKQVHQEQLLLKVHEKTTYVSRLNARTKAMIHPAGDTDDDLSEDTCSNKETLVLKDDFVLSTTKGSDRRIEKDDLNSFIAKKREMFLVQYALGVKRAEIRKLEEMAKTEEKKLELAERHLEEDAMMFDEFLKSNDKNAVEAVKMAEAETKAKLEKVADIKKLNIQIMGVKSEIVKSKETLKEYMFYKNFLDKLTPSEVIHERWLKKQQKQNAKEKGKIIKTESASISQQLSNKSKTIKNKRSNSPSSFTSKSIDSESNLTNSTDSDESSDEEDLLYFTSPFQLLEIFAELEEHNLSLILNSQDTEEALDEMKKTIIHVKEKMNKETEALKLQVDALKETIQKEKKKGSDFEMKSRMFSYGEFKADDQEKMLIQLGKKVEEVYKNCIGENEANISALQMLTSIENRLEELFETIEIMPAEKVEIAEKIKDKERRLRLREEKLLEQKKNQEERIRKAIERAKAEPKKKTGRRLVFRSAPPQARKHVEISREKYDKEEEELKYFFT